MADDEARHTHAAVQASAQATAASARSAERSATSQVSAAERNVELAIDRTVLAAERTYAAWVRTGLASLAAGIGARALLHGVVAPWLATLAGATLLVFSGFSFVAAVWRELFPTRALASAEYRTMPAAVLLTVNGVLVLVSLAALVGALTTR